MEGHAFHDHYPKECAWAGTAHKHLSIDAAGFYVPHATLHPETMEPVGKTTTRLGVEGGLRLVRVIQRDAVADEGGWYDLCEVAPF